MCNRDNRDVKIHAKLVSDWSRLQVFALHTPPKPKQVNSPCMEEVFYGGKNSKVKNMMCAQTIVGRWFYVYSEKYSIECGKRIIQ